MSEEKNKNIPFYNLERSEDTLWYRFMKNVYLEENIKRICRYGDDKEIYIVGKVAKLLNKNINEHNFYPISRVFKIEKEDFNNVKLFLEIRSQNPYQPEFYFQNNMEIINKCHNDYLSNFIFIEIFDSYSKKYVNLKEEYEKACKNYEEWEKLKEESVLMTKYVMNTIIADHDKQYFLFEEINNIKEEQRKMQETQKDILSKLDLLLTKLK